MGRGFVMSDLRISFDNCRNASSKLYAAIKLRRAHNQSWAAIAAEAGVSRRTLRRYWRRASGIVYTRTS